MSRPASEPAADLPPDDSRDPDSCHDATTMPPEPVGDPDDWEHV